MHTKFYECTYDIYSDSDDFFYQQNTIALQYRGITTSPSNYTWPSDVIYIDTLPAFTGYSDFEPIGNQAAFVDFVDAPFYDGQNETSARVDILPLSSDSDLGEIYSDETGEGVYLPPSADYPKPGLYYGIKYEEDAGDGKNEDQLGWLSPSCTP